MFAPTLRSVLRPSVALFQPVIFRATPPTFSSFAGFLKAKYPTTARSNPRLTAPQAMRLLAGKWREMSVLEQSDLKTTPRKENLPYLKNSKMSLESKQKQIKELQS
eukprot:370019_1